MISRIFSCKGQRCGAALLFCIKITQGFVHLPKISHLG
nr:MAG TPA: hypothetical protein [Herelleviridae sp.]